MREPNDKATRAAVTTWLLDQEEELRITELEVRGKEPQCTCPNWWFPENIRETARRVPHNYQGVLHHHSACAKVVIKRAGNVRK